MNVWQSIIPVISAAIASLLTYLVQRDMTARSQKWTREDRSHQVLIDRGEELYALAHRWQKVASANAMIYRRVMTEDIDYDKALDTIIEKNEKHPVSFDRIQLVLNVYFPEIKEKFDQVHGHVKTLSRIEKEFRERYKAGHLNGQNFLPTFDEAIIASERANDIFLSSLSGSLKAHIGIRQASS